MELTIVKVGGKIVETPETLQALLRQFSALKGLKILVHGGGRTATDVAAQLNIPTQMVDGRRITDAEMLRVVTMVYGGLVNKQVVAQLQACGVNALGLTGADMDVIRSHRRQPVGGVDFGFVGDVDRVDADRLSQLLDSGITPVVAPLTHNGQGSLLNTNADEDSVIPRITRADFERLKAEGVVSGGMLPKLENCLAAVDAGVKRVVITRADALEEGRGTSIV